MAITGAIFNSLIYGGVDSADYGVYISGDAVFNAPQRAVELVSVPGRNGSIAIDQGHFENIEVEYPAGMYGDDNSDFRQRLSDFRNAIMSQRGYQRLSDTYHPDEYRMGMYIEGLEVDPTHYNEAGQFTLRFNCKPQRYLTSGETEVTVESGDTITNPTLFDAQPLLLVDGYGLIEFNGYEIELADTTFGEIKLIEGGVNIPFPSQSSESSFSFNRHLVNTGDLIYSDDYDETDIKCLLYTPATVSNAWRRSSTGDFTARVSVQDSHYVAVNFMPVTSDIRSHVGTPLELRSAIVITVRSEGVDTYYNASCSVIYDGDHTITYSVTTDMGDSSHNSYTFVALDSLYAISTAGLLGNPTYIDCELGEAYKYEDGVLITLNAYIDLGSDLPVLTPGSNTITADNTITSLKLKPRWWKI